MRVANAGVKRSEEKPESGDIIFLTGLNATMLLTFRSSRENPFELANLNGTGYYSFKNRVELETYLRDTPHIRYPFNEYELLLNKLGGRS